jgi:hypothetical protein
VAAAASQKPLLLILLNTTWLQQAIDLFVPPARYRPLVVFGDLHKKKGRGKNDDMHRHQA